MSGRRSCDKVARTERAIAEVLQANGFAAAKLSRAYQPGHDIVLSLSGRDLCVEVKARAGRFRHLYNWLDQGDILIVKADRQEALVVLRMSLAAEIARAATPIRSESDIKGRAA
jgi:Holliday junction resolvase